MAENPKCHVCGTELPPSGQCPKCLIGLGLAAGAAPSSPGDAPAPRGLRHLAGYKLDESNTPHLTDFGLATILDVGQDLTQSTMILGTVPYLPPEQVLAQRVTAAADTYSLGVVLYELLVGQPPFRGATSHETMNLIEVEPPRAPRQVNRHIDKDLATICLKCLEKNPNNRYNSTADLADDLDRWLHNQPIKARPAGPLLRLGRWKKRNPLAGLLILSLILGLSAAMAFLVENCAKNKALQETARKNEKVSAFVKRQWAERIDAFSHRPQ